MVSIEAIDLDWLGIPQAIAAYIVRGPGGAVLIETGPGSTIPRLEAGLAQRGLAVGDLAGALVSHIHLDHAGAAWWVAQHGVPVYVHEFGARHLVDPARLLSSAERIYGEAMERLWGELKPIDESLIRPVRDGDVLDLAGMHLKAIETPGHARHHHAFALDTDDGRLCFTGDAAAMIVPGVDSTKYISLPTPPPEFDLDQWLASIDVLQGEQFDALYLTHFGATHNVDAHFNALRTSLREHVNFVTNRFDEGEDRDTIVRAYGEWMRSSARVAGLDDDEIRRHVTSNLISMNVTGLLRWHEGK